VYRRYHSAETSVLNLVCDALLAADRGKVTLIGFFNLSAAFGTVDHNILLDRLYESFGIPGQVLDWIHSFVSGRVQSVNFAECQSNWTFILCGVPQGSVLGPLLFILYAADVIPLAQRHGFQVHSYADDTQLYFHDKAVSCERRLSRFSECISDIEKWMTSNQLKMNSDKTDFIWLGSRQLLAKLQRQSVCLDGVHIPVSAEVTCLGVRLDSQLTFTPHIQCLARLAVASTICGRSGR